jgi:hypothetical protein
MAKAQPAYIPTHNEQLATDAQTKRQLEAEPIQRAFKRLFDERPLPNFDDATEAALWRCRAAYKAIFEALIADETITIHEAVAAAAENYRIELPPLSNRESALAYVACIAQGAQLKVFEPKEASTLLYAAQVASTMLIQRSTIPPDRGLEPVSAIAQRPPLKQLPASTQGSAADGSAVVVRRIHRRKKGKAASHADGSNDL